MPYTSFETYYHTIISRVSWDHWAIMVILSLVLPVSLMIRKKCSVYSAICIGITAFVGLFILDTAVIIRYVGMLQHGTGIDLGIDFVRLFHGTKQSRIETLSNIAVFVPFGFFFSEFISSTKRRCFGRPGLVILAGFGLSLCIESLQLLLSAGYFELMDLMLNTVGTGLGAGLSLLRAIIGKIVPLGNQ